MHNDFGSGISPLIANGGTLEGRQTEEIASMRDIEIAFHLNEKQVVPYRS